MAVDGLNLPVALEVLGVSEMRDTSRTVSSRGACCSGELFWGCALCCRHRTVAAPVATDH